jgi:hypothetical protein
MSGRTSITGRKAGRRAGWALAVALCLPPEAVHADPFLGRLECVSLQVNVLESGESFGVTPEMLRDSLRSGLKQLAPALKLDPACPDRLLYSVFLQELSTDTFRGFYGHLTLEVKRSAVFRETALLGSAQAWDLESYIHGPREQAKTGVVDHLRRHLAQFAEDYRAANRKE